MLLLRLSSQTLQLFSRGFHGSSIVAAPLLLQQTPRQVGRLTASGSPDGTQMARHCAGDDLRPSTLTELGRRSIWRQLTTWATRWQSKTVDDLGLSSVTVNGLHVSLILVFRLTASHFLRESVSLLHMYLKPWKTKSNKEQKNILITVSVFKMEILHCTKVFLIWFYIMFIDCTFCACLYKTPKTKQRNLRGLNCICQMTQFGISFSIGSRRISRKTWRGR